MALAPSRVRRLAAAFAALGRFQRPQSGDESPHSKTCFTSTRSTRSRPSARSAPRGALLGETAGASFFHSLEWLECYWKHFGQEQELRVLVISDGQRPAGILPLVVRTEATRVGRVRVLTYPLHDWATFFCPIGPCPAAILTAGMHHVRRTPRNWDVLDLRWIDADGDDFGHTPAAMAEAGLRPCRQKWDRTSLVELPKLWPDYWQRREPKFRKNIVRLEERMAERGRVEFVRCRADVCSTGFSRNVVELPAEAGTTSMRRWDLYDACVALCNEAGRATVAIKRPYATARLPATSATPMPRQPVSARPMSICSTLTVIRRPSPTTTVGTVRFMGCARASIRASPRCGRGWSCRS